MNILIVRIHAFKSRVVIGRQIRHTHTFTPQVPWTLYNDVISICVFLYSFALMSCNVANPCVLTRTVHASIFWCKIINMPHGSLFKVISVNIDLLSTNYFMHNWQDIRDSLTNNDNTSCCYYNYFLKRY